eukprot:9301804-Pyramimonas_sp.AAC.1
MLFPAAHTVRPRRKQRPSHISSAKGVSPQLRGIRARHDNHVSFQIGKILRASMSIGRLSLQLLDFPDFT